MIPCIGVSALRALVIRVTIKQIMRKRDHPGDRENGKCRFVPCAQEFLYLSLTVQYVHKKITVSLQHCASFYLLISYFEKLSIESGFYGEREDNKRESRIPPISFRFFLPPLLLGYLLLAGVVNNPNAKTRSIISFWPKQNR